MELANLAEFHLQQGNWTEAEPLLEQVLALAHPSIDDDLTAQTLINHAVVRLFAEDTETAEAALDEAHTLARKVGDKRSIGDCLLVRAALAAARGDHADAGRLRSEARDALTAINCAPSPGATAAEAQFIRSAADLQMPTKREDTRASSSLPKTPTV